MGFSLINEIRHWSDMFLTLRNFDSKEDKIEVEYHNYNLMTKRDFELDYEDICTKLEIIPGISFVH